MMTEWIGLVFRFTRKNSPVRIGLLLSLASAGCSTDSLPPVSQCPQPRFTGKAPDQYYERKNPLPSSDAALEAAERLYRGSGKVACATCHGDKGAGDGPMATQFDPRPRNFACAQTVNGIPDGQLFWIIRSARQAPRCRLTRISAMSRSGRWSLTFGGWPSDSSRKDRLGGVRNLAFEAQSSSRVRVFSDQPPDQLAHGQHAVDIPHALPGSPDILPHLGRTV